MSSRRQSFVGSQINRAADGVEMTIARIVMTIVSVEPGSPEQQGANLDAATRRSRGIRSGIVEGCMGSQSGPAVVN